MKIRTVPKILWFFCSLLFCALSVAALAIDRESLPKDVARIHFHLPDAQYEGWGLHLWGNAPALASPVDWGEPYPPTGSDAFGIYFDVPLQKGASALSFIVHKGAEKHVPEDQLLSFATQGHEVWLISGDATIYSRQPPIVADQGTEGAPISRFSLFWARQPGWLGFALAGGGFLLLIAGLSVRYSNRLRADIQRQSVLLAQARRDLERQVGLQGEVHARAVALAGNDELTGLMTRGGLRRALAAAQAKARRTQTMLAVLFIDLDEFKPVNDNYGHAVGDRVLVTVAERLLSGVRESDVVARLGGDEFLVIAEDVGDPLVATELARKLQHTLSEVIEFEGNLLRIEASIGGALYPSDGEGEQLIELADAAMYDAKRIAGKGAFRFASAWLNAQIDRDSEVELRWQNALRTDSLALGWQALSPVHGGPLRAWLAQAVCHGALLPRWVTPDPDLALQADLAMLEGLAAEVELGKAPSPTCLILAPARSSLCDPRFVSSCRGVHARIHERGASFVLELPVFATVPEPLRELLNQGIEIALRLSRPEQLSLSCLAEPGLRYIVVAGLPSAGPGDSRMLQALSAAAHALGIAIVFSAEFDTVLPIEADYRIGELKL